MRMTTLETVEVETGQSPKGSIIWLHGLGADGHDFEPIVPELHLPTDLPLRFVFPHAPVRPVTVNGGMAMRAWYDIVSLDAEGRADETGVRQSSHHLAQLIEREHDRGMAEDRILIAGFSQGGAIALHHVLRSPKRFAGLMALSAYLPLPTTVEEEVINAPDAGNSEVPAFVAHGTSDPMVPIDGGRHAAELLKSLGYEVEWREYPMAHAVHPQEIADIARFIVRAYAG
jgi:phospholipase/carboxylesterase